jgi:hypothetical protein
MKYVLFCLSILATLTVSAIELPDSIECKVYKFDIAKPSKAFQSVPLTIIISQEELESHDAWNLPAGDYDGISLALNVGAPNEKYGDTKIHVALMESLNGGSATMILASTNMENNVADINFRQPKSNNVVSVQCRAH